MAATKRLADDGVHANGAPESAKPSKKQKLKDDPAEDDDAAAAALKKQKKKEKKEKREKSEGSTDKSEQKDKEEKKKRKEEKREKKRQKEQHEKAAETEADVETPVETVEDTPMADAVEDEAEKQKKEKKERRKEKKEKKEKKNKSGSDAIETSAPATNVANGASSFKGGYEQTPSLSALPQTDIDSYLSEQLISVEDPLSKNLLRPVLGFAHLPTTELLRKSPFGAFKAPTPIQAASWPFTLSGRDVIGVAETGSGKTMAFALPCVEAISRIKKRGIKAVVVSPTRELAMQTHEQTVTLASHLGLKCVCVYGGAPKEEQRAAIRSGADIIVATPGRLKDFMSDGTVSLEHVRFAVLDEADRMLDKGFEEDIKAIMGSMPQREARQTLMFTATWPASVRALAATFMVDPVRINIGGGGKEAANGAVELEANKRITQKVEVVEQRSKEQRLLQILKQYQSKSKNDRILVFCLYKKEATRVETFLQQRGIRVGGIHGDLRQDQRTRSLEAFKTGQVPVLVATDVAARGLDIPEVKLVINVTFPLTIEDYVHRIGRTGRAGKTGEAITLFTQLDKAHSGSLINILKGANQPVPDELFKFGTTVKKKAHDTYGAFFKDVDMSQKATKIVFD